MNNFTIPFNKPRRIPEANVQAELYSRLRNAGVNVMLEYRHHIEKLNCVVRIDLVIIQGNRIISAIECKSRSRDKGINKHTRQHHKYMALGIPFMYCLSMDGIEDCYNNMVQFYYKGKPFKEGVCYNVLKKENI